MSAIHAYAATAPKGPLQVFEFDPGELMPDEVEIKVTHCGICHSDLSMLENEWGMSQFPLVPGHEAVGTVLALGKNAKGLQVGQRVGMGWSASTIHGRYIGWGPKPMVAVDIFRVANGKIAEHWDVMQEEVPAGQSASGNSMLTPSQT